jgi:hypothetical protein
VLYGLDVIQQMMTSVVRRHAYGSRSLLARDSESQTVTTAFTARAFALQVARIIPHNTTYMRGRPCILTMLLADKVLLLEFA